MPSCCCHRGWKTSSFLHALYLCIQFGSYKARWTERSIGGWRELHAAVLVHSSGLKLILWFELYKPISIKCKCKMLWIHDIKLCSSALELSATRPQEHSPSLSSNPGSRPTYSRLPAHSNHCHCNCTVLDLFSWMLILSVVVLLIVECCRVSLSV